MTDDLFDAFVRCLEDAICDIGTDKETCEFCGRTHGEACGEDEAPDPAIGVGLLDGKRYVHGCLCAAFVRHAAFLHRARHAILRAYESFGCHLEREAATLKAAGNAAPYFSSARLDALLRKRAAAPSAPPPPPENVDRHRCGG